MLNRLPPAARQRGVTLVEVMVGLTLGMVVSAALLLLFANASSNGQNIERASAQIENGRYAMDLLREDVSLAGFFGEIVIAGATYSNPDPCATTPSGFTPSPLGLPTPVRGYTSAQAVSCASNRLAGTDALAVRRLDTVTIDPTTLGGSNATYYLQPSFCNTEVTAKPFAFSKNKSDLTLTDRHCASTNPTARAFVSRIYFVASCNQCGSDSIPTLKRLDLVNGALVETALVEGVETMRVEYGFDTDGNGSADTYLTTTGSGATANWENVVAVKLHLIVRSVDKASGGSTAGAQTFELGGTGTVTTANDGYVRREYSATIRLVNPSSVRETP